MSNYKIKPIVEATLIGVPLNDTLHCLVALVPKGLPYTQAEWEECDDRSIAVPNTCGSLWFKVVSVATCKIIAHATFAADLSAVRCDWIEVDREHRRQGIAKQIYQAASCIFNAPVVPSGTLLSDGAKIWKNRTSITRCPY